ncbi:O-antigen polymerase [Qipengyuania marisflavi]|uniref:Oligosaccharide repeat unit polymerase n=1 Tax=Qipengyuania marisflavi TaxID=2486356 RepID=A0A5S3P333_9SPHN|nr:O-antigen polymerase [Qipengyuania marisflavi]TMM47339.1 oligosaccharide repeat unit polymerase [Qipengyuania marisflavi]
MYDFLLAASLIVFALVVSAYARHRAASLMHPATVYLAFHGLIFVFRPIVARLYDFDFIYRLYNFQPSMDDKITVILGANLALLTFVLVSLRVASEPVAQIAADEIRGVRARLTKPIAIVAAVIAPLAITSQIGNWRRRVNEFDTMMTDAATGVQFNVDGNGWFTDSALMLAPLVIMALWLSRYRLWGWAIFGAFVVLQSGSGGRAPLIYTVVAIGVLFLLERGRRWFDWRGVVLAVFALVAFNQIVMDRGAAVRDLVGSDAGDTYITDRQLDPLEGMDFANLEYFEYIVYAVPQRTGTWDYFASNLQLFTEPIPRALWPDKPKGSPVQFFQLWNYGTPTGMTASVPGMGWMSLGYIGIIIQASVFALIYASAYNWLLIRRRSAAAWIGYALIIATSVTVLRDGSLLTLARLSPFYVGPLLMVLVLARFSGPRMAFGTEGDEALPGNEFLALTPAERRRSLAAQAADQR